MRGVRQQPRVHSGSDKPLCDLDVLGDRIAAAQPCGTGKRTDIVEEEQNFGPVSEHSDHRRISRGIANTLEAQIVLI